MNLADQILAEDAFKHVVQRLRHGEPLNLSMIGDIFGQDFWKLLVLVQTNITINDRDKKRIVVNIQLPK